MTGTFTGVASGKLVSTNRSESPATFYRAASVEGNDPSPGGTLTGSLKIKWTALASPAQKFSEKSTTLTINSTVGGTTTIGEDTYGSFTIPGSTPGSITVPSPARTVVPRRPRSYRRRRNEATLTTEALSPSGISTLMLGSGTAPSGKPDGSTPE